MNIVFVIFSLNSGGMENYLLRFLEINHNKFENIYVWCKNGVGGELESKYKSISNVNVIIEKLPLLNLYLGSFNKFLKQENIDTVCDFTGNYAGLVMVNAARSKVKNRVVFYRRSSNAFGKNLFKLFYNKIANYLNRKYASNILANSVSGMNFFFRESWRNKANYKVIYNDINVDAFLRSQNNLRDAFDIPKNAFVIGHTGRFNEAKNHKIIMAVAEQLVNKYSDVYFILCGTGVKSGLSTFVTNKGIDEKVLLFESRSDIPEFLNTMDCFYFPSVTEGQPNSLIEAMVAGVPIVTSNIDAIKETVPNNYHAQLIDPLNEKLAVEKIEEIKIKQNKLDFENLKLLTIERYGQGSNFNSFLEILQN